MKVSTEGYRIQAVQDSFIEPPAKSKKVKISIITPAHNEEQVIGSCIDSVRRLQIPEGFEVEHIVVADRCDDHTRDICLERGVKVITKKFRGEALDPVTEAFELGVKETEGEIIGKLDADIILLPNWLIQMVGYLDNETVSISSSVKTRTGKWWLDFLMWLRDLNYRITPMGKDPRGAARLINRSLLREIDGFNLTRASWDTALDREIRKHGLKTLSSENVVALEYRPSLTMRKIIRKQIKQGKARKKLGVSIFRTLAHSVFRVRPFVIIGYIVGDK
ncbi:MAG: glycosyltransferase family 2 protein [Candidatus Bathyarchaeota archaeon]|nr:glycosyltransferase family 2 protein [Candidatus Bathyarchaeota archaeon]